jgi:hypothetical protein
LQTESGIELGSNWLRRRFRETGDWKIVIEEMKMRWARELEEVKTTGNGSKK